MLNRSTPTNDPRPRGIVSPRRAQTTSGTTIHDGNFITDNRRQTTVHNDNSRTINDSSSSLVFNRPVQGYIHTAKNRGAVNGYVQITNISHKAGNSGEASPRSGLNENRSPITTISSPIDKADRAISQKQESKKVGGQLGSSAPLDPDHKLEQELLGLSSNMRAFVRSLQNDAKETGTAEPAKRRNHTM